MHDELLREMLEQILTNQLFVMHDLATTGARERGTQTVDYDVLIKQINETNMKIKDIKTRW